MLVLPDPAGTESPHLRPDFSKRPKNY